MSEFIHRVATIDDLPAISHLMDLAIKENMKAFLSEEQIEVARESMGLDRQLIQDGTYFVIETAQGSPPTMVGCGGWGKRQTLYGGDHTPGRDDRLTDPAVDAARIRAMYTHPDWTRRGIGALLLRLGEQAAREAGYRSIELGATRSGEPLYLAAGYRFVGSGGFSSTGSGEEVIKMRKDL